MPRQEASISFVDLPGDILYLLSAYLSAQDISRLQATSKKLQAFFRQNCVWHKIKKGLKVTVIKGATQNENESDEKPSVMDACRVATNWTRGKFDDEVVLRHKTNQMPWMQHDGRHLWISFENIINCYKTDSQGNLLHERTLNGHTQDVGRFRTDGKLVVSGASDGSVCVFECSTGEKLSYSSNCHSTDVQDIDFKRDIIATGSKEAAVKVWCMRESLEYRDKLSTQDRVWSVALSPTGSSVAIGTAGRHGHHPLRLWDIESGAVTALGRNYKNGAGILHSIYESENILFSCGYDTIIRMWDFRVATNHWVRAWEEPMDDTIYCMWRDGSDSLLTGTARHGLVRLWDLRQVQPVQFYYTGRISSPVYSLVPERDHLYVALDKGIHMLNFNRY